MPQPNRKTANGCKIDSFDNLISANKRTSPYRSPTSCRGRRCTRDESWRAMRAGKKVTTSLLAGGYRKGTSDLEERDRTDYWRDIICDEYVKLDCRKLADDFQGEVRGGGSLGELQFSEVLADAQYVERSRRQIAKCSEADFLISFQLARRGLVRQNGREALLTPGSFALYDSTQPYSLTFNERFHQLVIQMPKEVLSRHLMNPEQYTAVPISGQSGLGAVLTDFIFSLARELHHVQAAPNELSENLTNMIAIAFSSSVMLSQVVHRKNNHPKRAWRQVRLEIEGLDWGLCGRAQAGISMVAKSWNAARTGFPGLRSQVGIRRSFSRRACPGLRCRDAQCAVVVLAVVAVRPRFVPECARGSWR